MTEEDAKTKWCPMVRVSCGKVPAKANHAVNRWPGECKANFNCIASDCALWVWDMSTIQARDMNIEASSQHREGYKDIFTGTGHCGLIHGNS